MLIDGAPEYLYIVEIYSYIVIITIQININVMGETTNLYVGRYNKNDMLHLFSE